MIVEKILNEFAKKCRTEKANAVAIINVDEVRNFAFAYCDREQFIKMLFVLIEKYAKKVDDTPTSVATLLAVSTAIQETGSAKAADMLLRKEIKELLSFTREKT